MSEESKGGLFASWNEDVRKRYIRILDMIVSLLKEIPIYPPDITRMDVLNLMKVAQAMDLDISELNLYEPEVFFSVHGQLLRLAIEKVEEQLRPGNPVEESLNKIEKENPDLVM